MKALRILALDIAEHTGWARWDGDTKTLRSGVLDFTLQEHEHPGARYGRVLLELDALACDERGPVGVFAWERVVTYGGGANALAFMYAAESRVVELAFDMGAEAITVAPPTLKKFATGDGRAKKPAMVAAAKRRWPGVKIERHDQADALHVLSWALANAGALPAGVLR